MDESAMENFESGETSVDEMELGVYFGLEAPTMPRATAVQKFATSLVSQAGLEEGAALSIARAAIYPDDARRRLAFPVAERVPGGTIYSITIPVFAAALSTYPVNLREAVERKYAYAGVTAHDDGDYASLSQVTSEEGETAQVIVRASSREHLIASLNRSQIFLNQHNAYDDSIAVNGVLREVCAVVVRVEHTDGAPPAFILGTADGSSRVGSCHRLIGATPEQIVYEWPADDRNWRTEMGRNLALAKAEPDTLDSASKGKLRALIVPAKIAIRYEPAPRSELTFAQAVRFIVGLTHVEPPTKWNKASELDALAEAALDELMTNQRITHDEGRFLSGDMTPTEAESMGFSVHADVRAAYIYKTILSKARLPIAKLGIRRITAKSSVRYNTVVDIAVELALRAWRPTLTGAHASKLDAVRSASQRAMRMLEVRDHAWNISERTPQQLREAAAKELADGIEGGPAALELAILGSWYMLVGQYMRRELSSSPDKRGLDKVLRTLMTSERGLAQLAQALSDGRAGRTVRQVDAEGTPQAKPQTPRDDNFWDTWIRTEWAETYERRDLGIDHDRTDTPESQLDRAQKSVVELAERLTTAVSAVPLIMGARRALILERGWNSAQVEGITGQLDQSYRELRKWAAIHDANTDTINDEPLEDNDE